MTLPQSLLGPHRRTPRVAVLLVNLGTPDAATAPAIRRYLRQFLLDKRVVEIPRLIWWLILHLAILPLRPRKLVHAYGSVWGPDGSPLMAISRRQQAALQAALGPEVIVELAMTYGNPSMDGVLSRLKAAGVTRLLVLPLYPQYSATTTAAVMDALFRRLMADREPPELRIIRQYHDDAGYIDALAESIESHWAQHGRGDHLLLSFHGIPQRNLLRGDPYHCHCHKTHRLLAERLGLGERDISISFQSRLGRMPWLQPYTDLHLRDLAARGIKRLDVACPGFSADCLETLEEVSLRYSEDFVQAGGQALRYVTALNDRPAHIDALATLARRHLQGWSAGNELSDVERLGRVASVLPASNTVLPRAL